MKNLIFLVSIIGFFVTACGPQSIPLSESAEAKLAPELPAELQLPALTQNSRAGNLKLPDNSQVMPSEDGSSVTFVFPENVFFVTQDETGEITMHKQKTYTCACSSDGSCSVLHTGNDFGCLHGGCTGSCTGSFSDDDDPPSTDRHAGGFVDLNQGISFVKSTEEFNSLLAFDPIILNHKEVKAGLKTVELQNLSFYLSGQDLDGPFKFVAMNFYGTLVASKVPLSFINESGGLSAFKEATCNCGSGSSGCLLVQRPDVELWICSGEGCSSCSMTVSDEPPGTD